jgi:RNA polymerase sigma-70 factor, ECF subfamily
MPHGEMLAQLLERCWEDSDRFELFRHHPVNRYLHAGGTALHSSQHNTKSFQNINVMEVAGIFTQFHQSLLAFIKSKINSRDDAEDILQNVFIKISAHVNSLSDEHKLQSWIYTITRNAIIDYYRKNAARRNVEVLTEIDENTIAEVDLDSTKGLDECVSSMIKLLPEEYRDIIIDAELNGIKQKDLAEKYGMAYPSLRSRVQRGRERLKQLFYNCCYIETDSLGNIIAAQGKGNCGPCSPCSNINS